MRQLADYLCPGCNKVSELYCDTGISQVCECGCIMEKQIGSLVLLNAKKGKWHQDGISKGQHEANKRVWDDRSIIV